MANDPYQLPITDEWHADNSIAATEDVAVIVTNTEEQTVFFVIGDTGTLPTIPAQKGHRLSSVLGSFPQIPATLKSGESMYLASAAPTGSVTVSKRPA